MLYGVQLDEGVNQYSTWEPNWVSCSWYEYFPAAKIHATYFRVMSPCLQATNFFNVTR